MLPRGGGTSQCGQTVGRALVLDCSKHMNGVLALDVEQRRALVQPGVVLERLNAALKPHGPVLPGRCLDRRPRHDRRHDRQQQLRRALAPLRQHGPQCARDRRDARRRHGGAHRPRCPAISTTASSPSAIAIWCATCARCIGARPTRSSARFPKLLRRVGGYNIDMIDDAGHNMAHLLVGSEGTLAFFTAIELELQPIPPHRVLGICHFPTFYTAMDATQHIVALGPTAVELVDRTMIELARDIPMFRADRRPLRPGRARRPAAGRIRRRRCRRAIADACSQLVELMGDLGFPGAVVEATDPAFQQRGVERAQGRPQHHDVDEGRREADLLHRGLRRAARATSPTTPTRLTAVFEQARHLRHLVRARLGRLPACAAGAQPEAGARRQEDARASPRRPSPWCANTRARIRASMATASCARNSTSRCSARASCAPSRR